MAQNDPELAQNISYGPYNSLFFDLVTVPIWTAQSVTDLVTAPMWTVQSIIDPVTAVVWIVRSFIDLVTALVWGVRFIIDSVTGLQLLYGRNGPYSRSIINTVTASVGPYGYH